MNHQTDGASGEVSLFLGWAANAIAIAIGYIHNGADYLLAGMPPLQAIALIASLASSIISLRRRK